MRKILLTVLTVFVLSLTMVAGAAEPQYHTVTAGNTLHSLAKRYGTTVVAFDFNPGITPDRLEIGQKLLVPVETLWSYHVVQPGDNTRSWPRPIRCPKTPCVLPTISQTTS